MTLDLGQLEELARSYTAAWCSQEPSRVAEHYAFDGSLTINGGTPSVGREAVTAAARSFMDGYPDMRVLMDKVAGRDRGAEYHWTFIGTNTGLGGNGNRVEISGFEEWTIDDDGLIAESQGHFDAADWDRQLAG